MLNSKDYQDIEIQDLINEINQYKTSLETLQKVLEERENKILAAFLKHDVSALKKALDNNKDKKISADIWAKLTFRNLTNINFYNYVISLPEYESYKYTYWKTVTKLEDAIIHSLTNKESFDFFSSHSEFTEDFNKIISDQQYAVSRNVSKEVIHELFQKKILKLDDDLISKIWDTSCINYIEYIIENNLCTLEQDGYKDLYLFSWTSLRPVLRKLTKERIIDLKKINLSEVVDKVVVHPFTKENNQYQLVRHNWLQFMRYDESLVLTAIKDHTVNMAEIDNIVSFFRYGTPTNEDFNKLHKFVEIIANEKIELINYLKGSIIKSLIHSSDKEINKELKKALTYIELNCELDSKDGSGRKVVKV